MESPTVKLCNTIGSGRLGLPSSEYSAAEYVEGEDEDVYMPTPLRPASSPLTTVQIKGDDNAVDMWQASSIATSKVLH